MIPLFQLFQPPIYAFSVISATGVNQACARPSRDQGERLRRPEPDALLICGTGYDDGEGGHLLNAGRAGHRCRLKTLRFRMTKTGHFMSSKVQV
jgi:hypothetical protein